MPLEKEDALCLSCLGGYCGIDKAQFDHYVCQSPRGLLMIPQEVAHITKE